MPHCPPRNPMKAHRKLLAAEGNLVVVDFGGPGPNLTKAQLAQHPSIKRSVRWVEKCVAEGMPASYDKRGRRRFVLRDVQAWLESRERRQANV